MGIEAPPPSPMSKIMGNVAFFGFLILLGGAFAWKLFLKPSDDPLLKAQVDPEGAMQAYLQAVDQWKKDNIFDQVEKVVTKEDMRWFYDNKDRIYAEQDWADIGGGINPTDAAALGSHVVMKNLIDAGPNRPDAEIRSSTISGNTAEMVVRKMENYGSGPIYTDVKVRLVKEGSYWKVKDFAGGRNVIENRVQPGDFVDVDSSTVTQPGGGPPPPAPDMAAAPGAGTLEEANQLIEQAATLFRSNNMQGSYEAVLKAYQIRKAQLGDAHPDTQAAMELGRKVRAAMTAAGVAPGAGARPAGAPPVPSAVPG